MAHRTRLVFRALALGVIGVFALPVACIYPEYTFNEPEPTGGQASSSGNMPGVEDCGNGIDDDGDSEIDCADSDCTPISECVPSPPLGWAGYVALYDGDEAAQPECPSGFPSLSPYIGHRNMMPATHSCDTCSCGDPTGQTCDLPDSVIIGDKNCGTTSTATKSLNPFADWQGECYAPAGFEGGKTCVGGPCNSSVSADSPTVVGGSCQALGGTPNIPPVQWEAFGKGCADAPQGGGCGMGKVCQPKSAAPFRTGLCVFKEGENTCPIGPFSEQFVYFEKADDTRACSACECEAPTGASCEATITLYGDIAANTCNTELATLPAGSCVNLTGNPAVFGRTATMTDPSGGSCAVKTGGGEASGSAVAVNPTTFCCIP